MCGLKCSAGWSASPSPGTLGGSIRELRDNSELHLAQRMCLLQCVLEEHSGINSNEVLSVLAGFIKCTLLDISRLSLFWTKSLNLISAVTSSLLGMHKDLALGHRFSF